MRRVLMLLALVLALAGCNSHKDDGTPKATVVTAPSATLNIVAPSAQAAVPCTPALTKVVANGTDVTGKTLTVARGENGFSVILTLTCVRSSDAVWLFDQSAAQPTDDASLYMDQGMSNMPSPVGYGSYISYTDAPVGDDQADLSDEPYRLVVVVDDNVSCNKALNVRQNADGDYKLSRVPAVCSTAGVVPFTVVRY